MNTENTQAAVKQFVSAHKRVVILVGVGLLLLFIGFVSGRYTKHPEVKTVTKTETKVVTEIQYKDRIVTQKVFIEAEKKHEHVETTTVKKPDGTVLTHTTTDDQIDEHEQTNSTQDAQHQQTVTQVVTQTVFKEKLVLQQPSWRLYAGAGLSVPYFLGEHAIGIPGLQGYVVQAGADRRIIGPFWLGVFGNTQGTVGLNLSAVW